MRTRVALLLVVGMVVTACGTRLPDEAFVDAQGQAIVEEGPASDGLDAGVDTDGFGETTTTLAGEGSTTGGDPTGGGDGGTTGGSDGGGGGGGGPSGPGGPNQASDVGITANSITLGTIVAEQGVLGTAFAPAARGIRAWAQAINARGGINGRQVILKTCNDREDRARALACAKQLVEQDKVFALVATNTRAFGGAAQYLNEKAVPVIGIPITNSFYRYPHLYTGYGTGYARDGRTVGFKGQIMSLSGTYRWFRQNLRINKAAVFYYDISESQQAGDFIAEGLELEGFQVTKYPVSFAAPSFDQAVADMERQGTQIVFDSMDDGANRKLCDSMARRRFKPAAKVSTIVSMGQSVGDDYNDTCRNIVFVTGSSIPYTTTSVPAVAEFRQAFAKYQPGQPLHQWALEAWAQGQLMAEGVASMGPAPTRKGLEAYLNALKGFTGGGIMVPVEYQKIDYSAPTRKHCFSIARWLDSKGGWTEATGRFPFCYPDAKQYGTPALEQGN